MTDQATTEFCGQQLLTMRTDRNMSREELGLRIDRTVSTVNKYELGTLTPSADMVGALSAALSCDPGDLLEGQR